MTKGLELSLATHSTCNVTLCLTAFAQLAFVQGDGDRAALLAGAAEGLRQRVGVRLNRQQAIAAVRLAQTSPAANQTSDFQRLREQPP